MQQAAPSSHREGRPAHRRARPSVTAAALPKSPLRREARRARLGSRTLCETCIERSVRWRESGTFRDMVARSLDRACEGVPRAVPRRGSLWRETRPPKEGARGGRRGTQLSRACRRQARRRLGAAQAPGRRKSVSSACGAGLERIGGRVGARRRSVACVRSAGVRGLSGARESKASSIMIGSGAIIVRSRRGTVKGVPLFQNCFVPTATAVANASTFRKIDTKAQVEIWNEQRVGWCSLGVASKGGERRSRAAPVPVCGTACWLKQSAPAGTQSCADGGAPLACAWRMDRSRARTSASIAGLESVKVKQSLAVFGGGGAFARRAAGGLTRV
eukprot:6211939-Pleurochrysis_carterae.AAC.4